jgi:hypothetical protein
MEASCQAPSGQLPFSLCFPYPAWASAHQAVLHTPTIVLLRQIPRPHRAATGTTALTGRKSSSAGTFVSSMNRGNKQLLERYLELPPQPDRSRPTRRLRHRRVRQLTLRFSLIPVPAKSARPVIKLAAKPQPETEPREQEGTLAPSIPQTRALQGPSQAAGSNPTTKSATRDATPDGAAEPSGRPAASIPQIPALQKDALEAEDFNTAPISVPPDATSNADVEKSGLEGSLASPIPQAAVLQKDASPVDESTSVEPAEEVGELMFKSADQASDNAENTVEATNTPALIAFRHKWNISSMGSLAAMPTGETVAILMFGIALAGILYGVLLMIVETRRVADHPESSLINDRNQLVEGETDLEAALLANMMALARPLEAKRSDGAKPFLLAPIGSWGAPVLPRC